MTDKFKETIDRLAMARNLDGGEYILITQLPEEKGFTVQMDATAEYVKCAILALYAELLEIATTAEECCSLEAQMRIAMQSITYEAFEADLRSGSGSSGD